MTEYDVAKLQLQEGDILLIKHPVDWSNEQIHNANEAVKEAIEKSGNYIQVIFHPDDVEFSIVRA